MLHADRLYSEFPELFLVHLGDAQRVIDKIRSVTEILVKDLQRLCGFRGDFKNLMKALNHPKVSGLYI